MEVVDVGRSDKSDDSNGVVVLNGSEVLVKITTFVSCNVVYIVSYLAIQSTHYQSITNAITYTIVTLCEVVVVAVAAVTDLYAVMVETGSLTSFDTVEVASERH